MILRRLSQSLKEQNWTAIWIEFILLVTGVFLGIQVSNWNSERVDNVRAQVYVERIRGNLQTDIQTIESREVFWRQVQTYGRGAIGYAETGELVDGSAWKTVLAFYQASQLWPWAANSTTYQEIKSSGKFDLIRDPRLRDALGTYYLEGGGPDTGYIIALNPEYRKIVRGLTPAIAADYVWQKCWYQPDYKTQILLDCPSPITEAQAQQVLDGYLKDPKLLSELRFWVANQGVALNLMSNNKKALQTMLASIPQEEAP